MGSNFALPLRSCVTLGKWLTISGTASLSETGEKVIVPPSQSGGENETRCRMGSAPGTRYVFAVTIISVVIIVSQVHPGGDGDPCPQFLLTPPWAPWAAPLAAASFPSQPLPTAPFREVGTEQGGNRRREREASPRQRQQMGTIWAGGARGGLAAAGAGGPGSPSPSRPGTVPARASGFSGRQRGRGGLAGLRGWAGGFPLWALLSPDSFSNGRQERGEPAHPLPASPSPGTGPHLPL